jgi:iron complex transport system substrate-binding protein
LSACADPQPAHDRPIHRIVSLAPAVTEDLFAIGAGDDIVGITAPASAATAAAHVPVIAAGDTVDPRDVIRLHPDIVVGEISQDALAAEMHKAGLPTLLLANTSFDDIFRTLETLGVITGRTRSAHAVAARLQAQTLALLKTVRPRSTRPRVAVLLSIAPLSVATTDRSVAKLVELAGGQLARDVAAADMIVAGPAVPLQTAVTRPPLNAIPAVRKNRCYALPDPAILEEPGPRYNDGLAWLIQKLNALPD